jgi:hypothetical protein
MPVTNADEPQGVARMRRDRGPGAQMGLRRCCGSAVVRAIDSRPWRFRCSRCTRQCGPTAEVGGKSRRVVISIEQLIDKGA